LLSNNCTLKKEVVLNFIQAPLFFSKFEFMRIILGFFILFLSFQSLGQEFILKGQIRDAATNETIVGAKVVANGTYKVVTDLDGYYLLTLPSKGEYTLEVTMMLFEDQTFTVVVEDAFTEFPIKLGTSIELEEVKVIGNLVTDRKTPVAVTKISQKQITEELGSRDLPMLLNATPGVYATQSGGGDGDARINIRGFDQRNIGVLIDGVPVNDMENGAVYWSNWFGLDAITSTVQVQRGLGATKLALPSIGGSINIITRGIGNKAGGQFKQEYGTGNFLRSTISYNSGLSAKGYGLTMSASYKQADGWVNGTNSQGFFTYLKLQKKWKNHLTSISGFMAPQSHGQRSYQQPIKYWDKEYAKDLGISVPDSLATQTTDLGIRYNQHWGYFTNDKGEKEIKNERLNYYNKPQITLKDFWLVNKKFSISNLAYMSIGRGGGTRINNSSGIVYTADDQTIDWDYMIADNRVTNFFGTMVPSIDQNYSPVMIKAKNILYASVNNHFWVGFLPQFTYNMNANWSFSGGLDVRYYEGEHYQEITDLLGADYFVNKTNQNDHHDMKFVGDKMSLATYSNHRKGLVNWLGAFGQAEYSKGRWTGFVNISGIRNGYKGIDYFQKKQIDLGDTVLRVGQYDTVVYNGKEYYGNSKEAEFFQTDWKYIPGGTFKTGASYELTEYSNVFLNLGYLSRTPQFSNVIDNNYNAFFKEIKNELIQAIEAGYSFANKKFGVNVNGYFTNWKNKPFPYGVSIANPNDPEDRVQVNLNGMDAIHYGGEVDFGYKLDRKHSFEAMLSVGNWTWNSSQTIEVLAFDTAYQFTFDAKGVHVGDAAQTVMSLSYRWEPIKAFYMKVQYQLFDRYYADFSPFNLQGENGGRESWIMPTYGLLNVFVGYTLPVKKNSFIFNGSVINVLNTKYISDASPIQGSTNAFNASGSQVYFGSGLRFNLSAAYNF
jgi:hypothetical protein